VSLRALREQQQIIRDVRLGPERHIADRIWELREERGWSGSELGRRAGLSRATVTSLDHGLHTPTLGTLRRVAQAFGMSVNELLEDTVPEDTWVEGAAK
jgi:transcriptional regulator with XRE-family HTH domain